MDLAPLLSIGKMTEHSLFLLVDGLLLLIPAINYIALLILLLLLFCMPLAM
jgi:hypothetical protein